MKNRIPANKILALGLLIGFTGACSNVAFANGSGTLDLAIIGDVPYGQAALDSFPVLIKDINNDPDVKWVVHIGDIKNGSSKCTDAWFEAVRDHFDTFEDPLVYTPGDNEWTDCHRDNNDNDDPLERLDKLLEVFFDNPGTTLGANPAMVETQTNYPENQMWMEANVMFATLHVVGSDNNLAPWTCFTPFTPECPTGTDPETENMEDDRENEFDDREDANEDWIEQVFETADDENAAGVALFLHADMWRSGAPFEGFEEIVEELADEAEDLGKPVVIISGDSHNFRVDQPARLDLYGEILDPNITQIIIDRSIETDTVWLRLRVDPNSAEVFTWNEEFVD